MYAGTLLDILPDDNGAVADVKDGVVHDHNAVAGTWTLDYDSTSGNRAYVELRELLSDLNRRRRADMPLVAMGA